ncbi:TPA: membrane protein insertion efficiency factor YidD [Candidatus Falkowbacteria bacterium]|nr:membrane protein insertion efficiency factor YidD [Candidatus Falkowbacteria bacterium]HAY12716.1 membrane protein insertion efficiency factor YidD [Candidatus Falkowbacteria bacterium]HBI96888.1 membrane protein insertion efficiency factor YidD [Candidatus Falkowbacteria bacterium]HBT27376.1 membrane protein insertion efficiency factor YidD [Candidatus Falkowbacteria bacterium]HBY14800.1 membrane protein insertion efficiency factor YidD [Candidatus Falkowbacteria bacterium]
MKKQIIFLIKLYQKTLSPDHGIIKNKYPFGYCRFYPTCSEYAIQTIEKNGIIKGCISAIWRILRCNPFNKGGIDLVK